MSRPQPPRTSADLQPAAAPVFTGQPLDRADRLRKDEAWVAAQAADPESRAVVVSRDGVLVDRAAGRIIRAAVPEPGSVLLGIEDGTTLFAIDADPPEASPAGAALERTPGAELVGLRELGETLPAVESGLAAYAVALVTWHRRHRFCANCGTPTDVREGGYMRACPNCGASHFPRLDPVVIMLVEHDGRLLLGRRHSWPPLRYSALAGFVSPGEAAEEAVLREVWEESGITAHSPRFVASQPWPFPSSLMLGFHALSDGGDPFPRDRELEDVRWFTTDEVRAAFDEDAAGPLKLPPRVAIARFLIDAWLGERDS